VNDDFDGQSRPMGSGPDRGFDEVAPLLFTKAVNLGVAEPSSELVYTLVVNNQDPNNPVTGGALTDLLPADVAYASGPVCNLPACAYVAAQKAITWAGNVPAQATLTIVYTVTVASGLADGTLITNTAHFAFGTEAGWTDVVTTKVVAPIVEGPPRVYLPMVLRSH
jgi:uncharacterized repeat protein (TIGR01451 family)